MVSKAKAATQQQCNEKKKKPDREIVQVFFRAPAEIIEKVEQAIETRAIPSSRQNWMLEAIVEKLER